MASLYDENDDSRPNGKPAPVGYVNFQNYFGANGQAAKNTANKLAGQATTAAGKASDALNTAKDQFGNAVTAGSVPTAPVQANSTNTGTGAATSSAGAPASNTGASANTSTTPPVGRTYTPPALPGSNSGALTGESTRPETGGGMTAAQMQANADKTYTGPGGLYDAAGYQQAQNADNYAQNQLNALGSAGGVQALIQQGNPGGNASTSAFSAGLTGSAGQSQFDKLRAQFSPDKDFQKAQADAGKTAAQAKLDSAKNADDWAAMAGVQGTAEEKQKAYDQAQADAKKSNAADAAAKADQRMPDKPFTETYGQDTPETRQAYMMQGVNQNDAAAVAKRQGEIANYTAAMQMTTQEQMQQTFNDINSVMSPSNWFANAAGIQDPTMIAAQKAFGGLSFDGQNADGSAKHSTKSGSTSAMHIPWDKAGVDGFFVWRQMTPDDWKTLNAKPENGANGQKAWIAEKARQLREAQYDSDRASSSAPKHSQS